MNKKVKMKKIESYRDHIKSLQNKAYQKEPNYKC